MGKGSPSTPDPADTARAQAAANKEAVREAAVVNQINQVTPFGTETYSGAIGSPERTRTVALTGAGQQQLDYTNQIASGLLGLGSGSLLQNVSGNLGAPLSFEGLPGISGSGDRAGQGAQLEQATYQRGLNLMQPDFDRAKSQLETQLANQGIPAGSQAYNDALGRLERSQGSQLENLALSSVGAGRQEQSRLAGLEQADRQQAINELLTTRSQPLNELSAILQGSPAIGLPQFQAPAQYSPQGVDVLGSYALQQQGQQAAANQQSNLFGSLIGAGGTLGGAALLLSSEEWKEDIGPPRRAIDGIDNLDIRAWRYNDAAPMGAGSDGAAHVGPMAEDFQKQFGLGDGKTIPVVDAIGVTMKGLQDLSAKVDRLAMAMSSGGQQVPVMPPPQASAGPRMMGMV